MVSGQSLRLYWNTLDKQVRSYKYIEAKVYPVDNGFMRQGLELGIVKYLELNLKPD